MYSLLLEDSGTLVVIEEESLQFQISAYKNKLDHALESANYNLLDPLVQKASRDLDLILLHCLFSPHRRFVSKGIALLGQ